MSFDVLCLRPQADFTRAGVVPDPTLSIAYRAPDAEDVPTLLRSVRALVIPAVGPRLAASLFDSTKLELVQVTGAGLDRLDRDRLQSRGIAVANVPGGSNRAVAEYVVTMASSLLRRFGSADAELRAGRYSECRARLLSDNVGGLEGLQVGVVGLGTIGRAVAQGLATAGCRIVYHDPALSTHNDDLNAQRMSLDDLLRSCDVVTLHVPLVDATRHLIDARALSLMKPGAVLINAARGDVVDEMALAASLADGSLAGAAVDVFSTEPPDASNPLLSLTGEGARRLILTPHIAGVTRQSSAFLFREAWQNVARVLIEKLPPRHRVY
ncbi:MAG: NAD(P)-binding domain-containing protein [Pseudomonadota bacterium]|nr:NAD(P)-binding domain-containing protein [Pseudomonadota bacterium]